MNAAQAAALHRIWERTKDPPTNQFGRRYTDLNQFLNSSWIAFNDECVMIGWQGMVLGIETDGHTHS